MECGGPSRPAGDDTAFRHRTAAEPSVKSRLAPPPWREPGQRKGSVEQGSNRPEVTNIGPIGRPGMISPAAMRFSRAHFQ